MATSVETLFSDIIPSARQQMEEQQKQGMLLAQNLTVPGFSAAMNLPQRNQALRQAAGGLLGLDTRTPVEREQESNQALFQQISTQAQQQFPNSRAQQLTFIAQRLQEANKLNEAQKAMALAQQAQLKESQIQSEDALRAQREAKAQQEELQLQQTQAKAERIPRVQEIKATIPFDATNLVKYYTDQAEALAKSGFNEEANEAINNAIEVRTSLQSGDTAAITNSKYYAGLSPGDKLNFQLANGRILDPGTAQELEAAKAQGRATGKEIAQRLMTFDERIATSDQMLTTVDELVTHPGFEAAVGVSAILPTLRPQTVGFEVKLEQLKGQAFLEQFNKLRGAGAITEKEGTAAAAALTALSSERAMRMGETEFLKELNSLKEILRTAQDRARKGIIVDDWSPKNSYVPSSSETPTTPRRRVFNPTTGQFEDR